MAKILCIYSSPTTRTPRGSISAQMEHVFVEEYKRIHPDDKIINLDLNTEPMAQKNLTAQNFTTFFNADDTDHYVEQLRGVDKVVLSAPMTNFNYPAVLKNYLDHILVAKKTFIYKYDRNGESEGLLKHLKVQLLTTQGADFGWYPWGNHTEALRGTWEFMGAKVLPPIIIYGTKTPAKITLSVDEVVKLEVNKIKEAASKF